jgi:TatD DNase family protein
MELTDTHCHLDFHQFDKDRKKVLNRAVNAGVYRILNPGIDLQSSRKGIRISETVKEVYSAVGVHPNCGLTWNSDSLSELRSLTDNRKVVAIGEIGLDYYRDRTPKDIQRDIFQQQLNLAADVGLPVIIHNRNASEDVMIILSSWVSKLRKKASSLICRPGVLHSFSENLDFAQEAIGIGFFIGISGPVTYKNASNMRETVRKISPERLLIETDSPFLTPHPRRGQRNEPRLVELVAKKISECIGLPFPEITKFTSENAEKLFSW